MTTPRWDWCSNASARCDHAAQQGVPKPQAWPQTVHCAILGIYAEKVVDFVPAGSGVSDVQCHFLGGPKRVQLPSGHGIGTGSVVQLKAECPGGRAWFLVVAQVEGDTWLCSDASCGNGEQLDLNRLFDAGQLVAKDLVADIWSDASAPPRKRVRPHVKGPQLCAAISAHPGRFSALVAKATWLAEERRCETRAREFDFPSATAGYTLDPLLWGTCGRASQTEVAIAWSWRQDGEQRWATYSSQLNHWVERRKLPIPPYLQPLTEGDAEIWAELVAAAERITTSGYALCSYVGLKVDDGYEPDPSKWPRMGARGTPKSQAQVFYEWSHVRHNGKRYRTSTTVHKILRLKETVPGHPLDNAVHRGLRFTMEFLDDFAERTYRAFRLFARLLAPTISNKAGGRCSEKNEAMARHQIQRHSLREHRTTRNSRAATERWVRSARPATLLDVSVREMRLPDAEGVLFRKARRAGEAEFAGSLSRDRIRIAF